MKFLKRCLVLLSLVVATPLVALADPGSSVAHKEDVIYGRKFGTALTMDVFTPKEGANGLGIVFVVSGGWISSHAIIESGFFRGFPNELIKRGYTVFAVVHGSQPRYAIPNILEDMHRAIRYIRFH